MGRLDGRRACRGGRSGRSSGAYSAHRARPPGPDRPRPPLPDIHPDRPILANGSFMAAGVALLWAATVWCVGLNAEALYGAPATARLSSVVSGATWLALPAVLSAIPAWFLVRALARMGIARRGSRMVRWVVFAWRMNLGALVIQPSLPIPCSFCSILVGFRGFDQFGFQVAAFWRGCCHGSGASARSAWFFSVLLR